MTIYVNMITKPGFVQTQLKKTNLSELISFIKLMEKQKGLIHEIRQFSQDSENLIILNEEQFKDIYQRWELCCQAIDQLKKNEDYKLEFKSYKSEMQGSLSELKNFSDKLWDYQKSLIEYHKLQRFQFVQYYYG
ncbi:hypothetical protein PPERSA_05735 [Pseudocohnilembus persalinus]|uniref:Uncharacterized protein n=1 Tax=Pseudocohnilembus persalinus TaxID=266149 RepID=A0A0V0QII0_PSEPJ|nr:hypothetical protein PPERSA_05735 [Pseudocohnilembus persalinus]|eukprot:KRX01896.1 hypothetical protein PPERSA_05735 [Pseudocohnilembus persalinus]